MIIWAISWRECTPTICSLISPPLISNSVGMPRTPYLPAVALFSSTLTLAIFAFPARAGQRRVAEGMSRLEDPDWIAVKS